MSNCSFSNMPRMCCVPGCKSNYRSEKSKAVVSTFKFPKDDNLKLKWVQAIGRKDFVPSASSVVCCKHFSEKLILRTDNITKGDGTVVSISRKIPKLSTSAVPHIFENQPSYRSSNPPVQRKDPLERLKICEERDAKKFSEWMKDDTINSFKSFSESVSNRELSFDFKACLTDKYVLFFLLNHIDSPKVVISFKVYDDFSIQIWYENSLLPLSEFKWLFGQNSKLDKWSQLDCLLSHLSSFSYKNTTISQKLSICANLMFSIVDECTEDEELAKCYKFLAEQLSLAKIKKQPRYSPDMIIIAYTLFLTHSGAYTKLRNLNILCLPHPGYLRQLSANLGTERSGLCSSHVTYLSRKAALLEEHEKYVTLLLDEIYVNSCFSYKCGVIEGFSYNSEAAATTVQTFMINSVLSKSRDVVALYPVTNLTGDKLRDMTLDVMKVLTSTGFIVVSIISDNLSINVKLFESLGNGALMCSIQNPFDIQREIFLMFDSVHIFKNIRNNWFNQHDTHQSFYFPSFEDNTKFLWASVNDLKQLYFGELNQITKIAPTLSNKVLFPSSLDKQKVSLVSKLFNDQNKVALSVFTPTDGRSFEGTIEFLDIIIRWWKIVNVKHPYKGRNLNDPFCDPVTNIDHDNLKFLNDFVVWVKNWNDVEVPNSSNSELRFGKLSKETSQALIHTTQTMIILCNYMFKKLDVKYILLGKFQTDNLEGRFGKYRQMSGGNYNVSVRQILESEKKLRLLSLIKFHSSKSGSFALKDFFSSCEEIAANERVDFNICESFKDIFIEFTEIIPENVKMVLIFISGYAAFSVSKSLSCQECRICLSLDKSLEYDYGKLKEYKYLAESSRGGLKWPTDFVVELAFISYTVFLKLISDQYENKFLHCKNQKNVLRTLCLEKWDTQSLWWNDLCTCKMPMRKLSKNILSIFSNIFINNYCKVKNDTSVKAARTKKRKLMTFSSNTKKP